MAIEGPPPIVVVMEQEAGLFSASIGSHLTGHEGLVHGGAAGALLVGQVRELAGVGQPVWIKSIIVTYPMAVSLSGGTLKTSGERIGARGFKVQLHQARKDGQARSDKKPSTEAVGSYVLDPYTLSHGINVPDSLLTQVPAELDTKPEEILEWAINNGKTQLVSYIKSAMPFYENLGVYNSFYYNTGSDRTEIHLDVSPKHTIYRNGEPTVDEGLIVALLDSCSGAQVFTRAVGDQIPVTSMNRVDFWSPIPPSGKLVTLSSKTSVLDKNKYIVDTEVWHSSGTHTEPVLVATGSSSICLLPTNLVNRLLALSKVSA